MILSFALTAFCSISAANALEKMAPCSDPRCNSISEKSQAEARRLRIDAEANFNSRIKPYCTTRALAELNRSIEVNPFDPEAYELRAAVKSRSDDMAGAIADLDLRIRLWPQDPQGYLLRAAVEDERGNFDAAFRDDIMALNLDGNLAASHQNLACDYLRQGDKSRALREMDRAIELWALANAPSKVLAQRASVLTEHGLNRAAIQDYSRLIGFQSWRLSAFLDRARIRYQLGDFDGALKDLSMVLSVDNDNVEAHYVRAQALLAKGEFSAAAPEVQSALYLTIAKPPQWLVFVFLIALSNLPFLLPLVWLRRKTWGVLS